MLAILLKTLPFFALIGLGWWAGRIRFFPPEATAWLTRFVFFFALSAMLFRFAATLPLSRIYEFWFLTAYLAGSLVIYAVVFAVARLRRRPLTEAAMEAHAAISGNTGFLGVPLLIALLGQGAAGPVLMVLTIDMFVFSSLITLIVAAAREGHLRLSALGPLAGGLVRNPMIVSMAAGLAWSVAGLPVAGPFDDFLLLLGAAATPGALFAIGASLATKSAERIEVAAWLAFAKLVLHPAAVGVAAFWVFPVDRFAAGVMVAAAALPVAGNVYMLAQHFGVAPRRVSAAILVSTAASLLTVTAVVALVGTG